MICPKCHNPIPQNAQKCNHCHASLHSSFSFNNPLPKADMFGNQVYEINSIKHKAKARLRYLSSLPETKKAWQQSKNGKSSFFWLITFFISIIIGPFILALFSEIAETLVFPFILFLIVLLVLSYKLSIHSTYKRKPENVEKHFLHYDKEKYYFNQNVIGFAVIDHFTDSKEDLNKHFAFCEVDKRNIKGISYDDKFAEYVLHLYKPVYSDYHFPALCEFRIADIFDDAELSNALGSDLPAKNMHY